MTAEIFVLGESQALVPGCLTVSGAIRPIPERTHPTPPSSARKPLNPNKGTEEDRHADRV